MSDETTDWLGQPGDDAKPDPVRAARGHAKPALPRRFYKEAGFSEDPDGFRLMLDGRAANTPARNPLRLPTRALAESVAAEWAAQETQIDPARMPLTRLANTAIDGVAPRLDAVASDLCAYAGTDLVAYRAGDPERLVAAQAAAWDPILDWARESLGVRLILSEGVMHVMQPSDTVRALSDAVSRVTDPFRLAGLHTLTTLSGSLLIALAVLEGRLTPAEAWAAAHVDETYQAQVWGRDAEAEARLEARRTEFEAAAAFVEARR
ncbi:Chaperone required for the assembly of the F1-ATPase [Methylobacterium phyllostachyos]|uniref:Chaperone required for the assembly of the F1-ATPase n=1 Tax=Methylobacterium phyllostachyos TaxID=582672 RepID=A0A1H0FUM2_9HYPH|nr:ATP12 family protein [Methylobacterium phyllostachyos]SDN98272.1 Chaperone required for the assembly of the F1-ATPase [Methylobacterium phyllostachyos]